jgi:hypothetical protein
VVSKGSEKFTVVFKVFKVRKEGVIGLPKVSEALIPVKSLLLSLLNERLSQGSSVSMYT